MAFILNNKLSFLCLLLLGADLVSFRFGEFTFRIVTILIIIGWLRFLPESLKLSPHRSELKTLCACFLVAALLSFPTSVDHARSAAYIGWLLFFVIFLVPYFFLIARRLGPESIIKLWFLSFRLQVVLLVVEYLFGMMSGAGILNVRPHLWFYESSYGAIYLTSYFTAAMYMWLATGTEARTDLLLSIIGLYVLTSATAFFGLFVGTFISIFYLRKFSVKYLTWVLVLLSIFVFLFYISNSSKYLGFVFGYVNVGDGSGGGVISSIADRGGSRIIRLLWGWDAFINNPVFGIGFGADKYYTAHNTVATIAIPYVKPWLDDYFGAPFVNPFVEAAGTMGIFGAVTVLYMYIFSIRLVGRAVVSVNRMGIAASRALAAGSLAMLLLMLFEGTILRYYVWAVMAMSVGAASGVTRSPTCKIIR